jgi:hypothetical protein
MSSSSGYAIQSSFKFKAVTPSDTVDLFYATAESPYGTSQTINEPAQTRSIVVAVSGNVAMLNDQGVSVTQFVAAGVPFPVVTSRIMSTNTTATGIVAYF